MILFYSFYSNLLVYASWDIMHTLNNSYSCISQEVLDSISDRDLYILEFQACISFHLRISSTPPTMLSKNHRCGGTATRSAHRRFGKRPFSGLRGRRPRPLLGEDGAVFRGRTRERASAGVPSDCIASPLRFGRSRICCGQGIPRNDRIDILSHGRLWDAADEKM
mmetsp:Transcript_19068/g.43411  ORF Transcript_19068/g.43411 Transcript_19068/m.43411 type:complete len:165 (-) Transcript_19068:1249-1743(-)